MTETGTLANVLYNFATFALACVEEGTTGATERLTEQAHEVQDLALKYLVAEFDGNAT